MVIAPLTGRAQAILLAEDQAGGVLRLDGRLPNTATTGAAGAFYSRTPPTPSGGGLIHRLSRRRRPRLLQPVLPREHLGGCASACERDRRRHDLGRPGLPTGTRVGRRRQITLVWRYQPYQTVSSADYERFDGPLELFLVLRNPGFAQLAVQRQLVRVHRPGSRRPRRRSTFSVNATPPSGAALLNVVFDSTATDLDRSSPVSYSWDFPGVPGSSPSLPAGRLPERHVYAAPAATSPRLSLHRRRGGFATMSSSPIYSATARQCPTGFRATSTAPSSASGLDRHPARRVPALSPNSARLDPADMPATSTRRPTAAKNVVLRPAPTGAFTIVSKINHKGLSTTRAAISPSAPTRPTLLLRGRPTPRPTRRRSSSLSTSRRSPVRLARHAGARRYLARMARSCESTTTAPRSADNPFYEEAASNVDRDLGARAAQPDSSLSRSTTHGDADVRLVHADGPERLPPEFDLRARYGANA